MKRRIVNLSCQSVSRSLSFYILTLLCRGNFSNSVGDDFFGLKELGIADELGMTNLTVPKRLLKGKKRAFDAGAAK